MKDADHYMKLWKEEHGNHGLNIGTKRQFAEWMVGKFQIEIQKLTEEKEEEIKEMRLKK